MNLSQAMTQIGQWFAALAQQVLPAGGTADQVLKKVDGTDYNVEWSDATGGSAPITLELTALTAIAANSVVWYTPGYARQGPFAPTFGFPTGVGIARTAALEGAPVTIDLEGLVTPVNRSSDFALGAAVYLAPDGLCVDPTQTESQVLPNGSLAVGIAGPANSVHMVADIKRKGLVSLVSTPPAGSPVDVDAFRVNLVAPYGGQGLLNHVGGGAFALSTPPDAVGDLALPWGLAKFVKTFAHNSPDAVYIPPALFNPSYHFLLVQQAAGALVFDRSAPVPRVATGGAGTIASGVVVAAQAYIDGSISTVLPADVYCGFHPIQVGASEPGPGSLVQAQATNLATCWTRTEGQLTSPKQHVELDLPYGFSVPGPIGFAMSSFAGSGSLGVEAETIGIVRNAVTTTTLEVWKEGVMIASYVDVADFATRLGILMDADSAEFWLLVDGVWLTDPGAAGLPLFGSFFPHYLMVEQPVGAQPISFYFTPSTLFYGAAATTAGAEKLGWLFEP